MARRASTGAAASSAPEGQTSRSASCGLIATRFQLDGHAAETVAWSYADPIPVGGLRDDGGLCILCETPKTFEDWAKFAAVTENGGGRLQPNLPLVLPLSGALQHLFNYPYNVKTLGDLIEDCLGRYTRQLGYPCHEMLD